LLLISVFSALEVRRSRRECAT